MTFKPQVLTYDALRAEAERLLKRYHPEGTIPVPIEQIVEFELSMDVIPLDGLKAEIGVDAFLTNDLEWIYVDQYVLEHAPARFRFSLAHEVAHYWLHDDLYQNCSIQSVNDWAAVQTAIGEKEYRWFEWQANSFAGLLLVPEDQLKLAYQRIAANLSTAGVALTHIDHHPTRGCIIHEVAKQFSVSEQTAEIRLERDGLLAKLEGHP